MSDWPKWILGSALVLCVAVVGTCWGIYWCGASGLPKSIAPAVYAAPELIREQYLKVEAGDIVAVPKLNPVSVWHHVYQTLQNPRHQELELLARASRLLRMRDRTRMSNTKRHAAELAGMIRISRGWTLQQIVDTLLSESWFGRDANGIEAASNAYFGVSAEQLIPEESLALVVLLRGPSTYDPDCNRERFVERYRKVAPLVSLDGSAAGVSRATLRMRHFSCSARKVKTSG